MASLIVSKTTIERMFDDALREMEWDRAVLHVAGITGQEPSTIEGVIAAREARQEVAA